ncbi:hypothetical protein [Streptomyces sp. NPDC002994]|uniref:hypothetical protein n=1 Tax=Streptomyces sp. NPDC002994 TaxID=3154441 RepID=UPI0033A7BA73
MYVIALQDYDHHGRVWALDPLTGASAPASGRCHGFVRLPGGEGGQAAALYADAGKLWLQYGEHRWDCETVVVRHARRPDGAHVFTVLGGEGTELEVRCPAPDPGPFDPTYDWIDTVADDFFLWVAGQLAEREGRRALLEHFLTGFDPV